MTPCLIKCAIFIPKQEMCGDSIEDKKVKDTINQRAQSLHQNDRIEEEASSLESFKSKEENDPKEPILEESRGRDWKEAFLKKFWRKWKKQIYFFELITMAEFVQWIDQAKWRERERVLEKEMGRETLVMSLPNKMLVSQNWVSYYFYLNAHGMKYAQLNVLWFYQEFLCWQTKTTNRNNSKEKTSCRILIWQIWSLLNAQNYFYWHHLKYL